MTLMATGMLDTDVNIQDLRTLVRRKALRQFDFFFAGAENTETLNVDYYIKGLMLYLPR